MKSIETIYHNVMRRIALALFRRYIRLDLSAALKNLLDNSSENDAAQYVRGRGLLCSVKRHDATRTIQVIFGDIARATIALIDSYGVRKP